MRIFSSSHSRKIGKILGEYVGVIRISGNLIGESQNIIPRILEKLHQPILEGWSGSEIEGLINLSQQGWRHHPLLAVGRTPHL